MACGMGLFLYQYSKFILNLEFQAFSVTLLTISTLFCLGSAGLLEAFEALHPDSSDLWYLCDEVTF